MLFKEAQETFTSNKVTGRIPTPTKFLIQIFSGQFKDYNHQIWKKKILCHFFFNFPISAYDNFNKLIFRDCDQS